MSHTINEFPLSSPHLRSRSAIHKMYINNTQCACIQYTAYVLTSQNTTAKLSAEGHVLISKDITGVKGHHRGSREAGNHRSKCHKTQYCKMVSGHAWVLSPQHS